MSAIDLASKIEGMDPIMVWHKWSCTVSWEGTCTVVSLHRYIARGTSRPVAGGWAALDVTHHRRLSIPANAVADRQIVETGG